MGLIEFTGLDQKERAALLRGYARFNESELEDVHDLKRDLFRLNRERGLECRLSISMLDHGCLVLALNKRRMTLLTSERKIEMSDRQAEQVRKIHKSRAIGESLRRVGKLEKLIKNEYQEEIEKCRKDGMSWRAIARYLSSRCKKRISHTYARQVYLKAKKQGF